LSEEKKSSRGGWVVVIAGLWIGVLIGGFAIGIAALTGKLSLFDNSSTGDGGAMALIEYEGPAPDFELPDVNGQMVRLSDLEGQVVVVNFWATWCGPCVREMPLFQEYQDRYGPGLVVLGVNEEESPETVREFVDELGISYTILIDRDTKAASIYKVMMLPTTLFIDKEGILRFTHYGTLDEEQFSNYLTVLGVIE